VGKIEFLFKEEAEARMAELVKKIPRPLSFGVLPNGMPFFAIPRKYIIMDEGGFVSWSARERCIGMHSFIELTIGEGEEKLTVYLPICLVHTLARLFAMAVARTTIDPRDGRYNSKPAEILVIPFEAIEVLQRGELPLGETGFAFKVKLEGLVTQLRLATLLGVPLEPYKSKHCPFCAGEWIIGLPKRAKR